MVEMSPLLFFLSCVLPSYSSLFFLRYLSNLPLSMVKPPCQKATPSGKTDSGQL